MLFSSIVFLFFFFPIVLAGYYLLSFSRMAQNVWLFIFSIVFYAWGEPIYVLLMLSSIVVNWGSGLLVDKYREKPGVKKAWLIVACIFNLGMLFVFKYTGFLIDNINQLARADILPQIEITLPIGISFYTFQALSYVIDVYRGDTKVEKNPFYVGLYVAFFPQLIAGPIVKYNSVAQQIRTRKSSFRKLSVGICRFVTGLGKKILLANSFALLADQIFNWSELGIEHFNVPVVMAWMGAIAYTLQIYFDFSGYSDMAIGLGLIFGFKFEENFNYPYVATSVTDFWKRWHISLTSWFRQYVYIPLGGNRVENKDRMILNMFIVWLLTGIWHGAEWTFIFWGLWHFLFQLAERLLGYHKNNSHTVLMRIYTLLEVTLGWVLFRAKDLYQTNIYLRNMFGVSGNTFWDEMTGFLLKEYWLIFALGFLFSTPIAKRCNELLAERKMGILGKGMTIVYPVAVAGLFLVCVSYLVRGGYNPFIYFNF
ncbi:MAG: MBOAT family protein [Lachnospiraceae bacterium]|nr:MBOAT family protein [Lachnospiraceae bacterium]